MPDVMDIDVALFLSLYVVIIQALAACQPTYAVKDNIVTEGETFLASLMNSDNKALAISTLALYDYHLFAGLICFKDELRFWVKPRSTTWFS
jgi:hypothetical protein